MRPYQWTKNLFVLAPLLFGRKFSQPVALVQGLIACGAFCLLSSAIYILNDIVDAPKDRLHPQKRDRPIARGALPVSAALTAFCVLSAASFWLAAVVSMSFLLLAAGYSVLMIAYTVGLKRAIVLDAMILASGFVLRVVGGAVAAEVQATHWLIACTFLLALYLAFVKRRQELLVLSGTAFQHREVLGKYSVAYIDRVNNILMGATMVCYALYTVAPDTTARFGTDVLIYGSVFVVYGLFRYMALTESPAHGGDPSKLVVRDVPLLVAILGWLVYNAAVIYRSELSAVWDRLR